MEDQLLEFREQIEDKVAEEVEQRVAEVEQQASTRITEIRDIQRAAEKRLAVAVESMKQAQASAERAQNQLFDVSNQAENKISALLAENSILAEGVQRSHSRCQELEAELDSVKAVLSALQIRNNNSNNSNNITISGGFSTLVDGIMDPSSGAHRSSSTAGEDSQTLHLMINDLRQEIRLKEESARSEKLRLDASLREMSQQLSKERTEYSICKHELMERPTKEDLVAVRKQLKLLHKVVFNANDDEDDEVRCYFSLFNLWFLFVSQLLIAPPCVVHLLLVCSYILWLGFNRGGQRRRPPY